MHFTDTLKPTLKKPVFLGLKQFSTVLLTTTVRLNHSRVLISFHWFNKIYKAESPEYVEILSTKLNSEESLLTHRQKLLYATVLLNGNYVDTFKKAYCG